MGRIVRVLCSLYFFFLALSGLATAWFFQFAECYPNSLRPITKAGFFLLSLGFAAGGWDGLRRIGIAKKERTNWALLASGLSMAVAIAMEALAFYSSGLKGLRTESADISIPAIMGIVGLFVFRTSRESNRTQETVAVRVVN